MKLNKLNSLHRRIICTKFDWFWQAGSGKDFFLKFECNFTLLLLSPLGEGQSPSFEQIWIPSPKDDLCQVCLKLAQWFWRRFLNDTTSFLHFCDYFPFEEDLALIWTKLNSLHLKIICTKFDWILPSGSGEEAEYVKVYRRTDRRTPDNERSEKLIWVFSSGELKRELLAWHGKYISYHYL
jgi:hypothetical protein